MAVGVSRGVLIVLEGCDRCGKSTQCRNLVSYLNSIQSPTKYMRFPNRETHVGKMIDSYLKNTTQMSDEAIHLLFSANRWEAVPEILEALSQGQNLVIDRYAYSGVCFTAAKRFMKPKGGSEGAISDLEWIKSCDKYLPKPDLVLFLDLPSSQAAERGDYGSERYEETTFQTHVRQIFQEISNPDWKYIDASGSPEAVFERCKQQVLPIIESIKTNNIPLGKLWDQ
eukprot:Sdes_comp18407_c0_seq1m8250